MQVKCIKYLSDGSYANIWLAIDELNRSVAVKVMKPEGEGVSTLAQHAEVLIRAKHENVVDVYSIENVDIPEDGVKKCIVMEFISGDTLDEFLKIEQTRRDLYKVGAQILEGLMFIHNQGLVHMDLHERNIMVTDNNHVKLIDIMYRNSLKKLEVDKVNERVGYDIKQLKTILRQIVFASELGSQGLDKFNELTNNVEDLTLVHNIFHDVFTFARSRCETGINMLKEPLLHELRLYKFRAECLTDFLDLLKLSNGSIRGYRIENDTLADVDVELVSISTKSEILNMMDKVEDSHIMKDTLESIHEYTGIRF